jgi:hypothetical protein
MKGFAADNLVCVIRLAGRVSCLLGNRTEPEAIDFDRIVADTLPIPEDIP